MSFSTFSSLERPSSIACFRLALRRRNRNYSVAVLVQGNNKGKWGTLMIGPDVDSFKLPEVLDAGKSMEFPFRLGDSGRMRLRLTYWNGSLN